MAKTKLKLIFSFQILLTKNILIKKFDYITKNNKNIKIKCLFLCFKCPLPKGLVKEELIFLLDFSKL